MIYLYHFFNFLILLLLVAYLYWQAEGVSIRKAFFPALLLKLGLGLILGIVYYFVLGGGDTAGLHRQATLHSAYFRSEPLNYIQILLFNHFEDAWLIKTWMYASFAQWSNSFYIIKLMAVLNMLTGDSYFLNSLYFSLFSFAGMWQLTSVLSRIFPKVTKAAVIAFLFFPSVVFWSSGIVKESILMGALGFLLAAVLQLVYLQKYRNVWVWLKLLVAGYMLWKIKYFVGAALFPLLFTFVAVEFIAIKSELFRKSWAKAALFFGFLLVAGYVATHSHPTFTKDYFLHQILKIYTMIQSESAGKNTITFPDLQPTFESLAYYAPEALFSAIYRPFIWEQNSKFLYAVSLENLSLVFLTLVFFYSLVKNGLPKLNLFYLSLFFYILILGTMMGLTTPNFGTLHRYRIAFLPFLVYLLLLNPVANNWLNKLSNLPLLRRFL